MLRRTFDPTRPNRYVRYGRMSGDEQNPRSPDQQFETIDQVRNRNGWPWIHVRDYRDDAVSGRLLRKRLGFQKMLQDIRTGMIQVDLVLVDTYERFGRADEMAAIRRELFDQHGVLVLTADSGFADPTSVSGQALTFVEQVRSTQDGRIKAHNVLRGKRDLIRQKKAWPGGSPPFGLQLKSVFILGKTGEQEVDHKILVRNPKSAWIVEQIYRTAHEKEWGTSRLAQFFNADSSIPDEFKPFSSSAIGYILDNPIYYGELRWEKNATGIVNDTRVLERNAEEDVLHVPDFCEAIIPRSLWDEVQALRQVRRNQILTRRKRPSASINGKQIEPPAPGLTLKYLLTGLARCGNCGASLRPSASKRTAKRTGRVWRRTYYVCPSRLSGSCTNRIYIPEDALREAVIARLRARLFPLSGREGDIPDWWKTLMDMVRRQVKLRTEQEPDQRSACLQEINKLEERVKGWSLSLANSSLDSLVRADLEVNYGKAKARIAELNGRLAEQEGRQKHIEAILDSRQVHDRLHRLSDVLARGNPTRGNLELALHIDRIDCFADGKVVMRASRLGVFDGAVELLRQHQHPTAEEPERGLAIGHVQPRRRARHRIEEEGTAELDRSPEVLRATDPKRFAGLHDQWFWDDCLEIRTAPSWFDSNLAAVAALRAQGWTIARLAAHFGKSVPTIRKALRRAEAENPSLKQLPRKMPRACWAHDHGAEVAQLAEEGKSVAELARHYGKSEPTIRAALKHARTAAAVSGKELAVTGEAGFPTLSETSDSPRSQDAMP